MEEKVLQILQSIRGDIDFLNEEGLFDRGLIGSFDVITIMTTIMDELGVTIEATDIEPENLNSYKAICDLVRRKMS